jgi:hypothetical protein
MNPGAPWDSALGWPVYGPRAFAGGSPVLTALGQYYAWGMWFEHGFIWWIDYDQNTYPESSDEAQLFLINGDSVYCDNEYTQQPTVFYGGSGDLAVNVTLESYSLDAGATYNPLPFNGTNYELALPAEDGLSFANIKMFASATGGNTQLGADVGHPDWGDCLYKHYVWAFRNGTIQAAGTAYDPAQRYATATYGSPVENRESMYTVRVQVTDASKDLNLSGTEVFAYGDSFMLHVGHSGSGGGGGEILVVRNDGGNYDANYDALLADLDEIGASYSTMDWAAGTDDAYTDGGYMACIWYRGGPGAAGEPNFTSVWSQTEWDEMWSIVSAGGPVLNFSQAQQSSTTNYQYLGYSTYWGYQYGATFIGAGGNQTTHGFAQSEGMWSNDTNGVFDNFNLIYVMFANQIYTGALSGLDFGAYSTNAIERNTGTGSSGDIPISFTVANRQFNARARYQPFDIQGFAPNPGWSNGITAGGQATLATRRSSAGAAARNWEVQSADKVKVLVHRLPWGDMTIAAVRPGQ